MEVLGTTTAVLHFVDETRTVLPIPFTRNGEAWVVGEEAHVSGGPTFRLRVFENGRVVEGYGIERAPQPVRDLETQYLALVRDRYSDRARSAFERVLEASATPRLAPAFDRIRAADDGSVWVKFAPNYGDAPEVWAVFGPDRAHLGDVAMPDRFRLEAPLVGAIVGVWTDDFDVQHVRRYTYDRTGGTR